MAQKKITDLQLRDNVTGTLNFPSDDTIQSYRVTAEQIKDYILAAGNVVLSMLAEAVRNALVPTGSIQIWTKASAPNGFLLCDGSAVSRTTYADLFAVIGEDYGAGDGSTTFNLPNPSGLFLRFAGSQTVSAKSFTATLGAKTRDNTALPVSSFTMGNNSANHTHYSAATSIPTSDGNQMIRGALGTNNWNLTTSTQSANHTHSINGGGDTETKPGNISFTAIIKY